MQSLQSCQAKPNAQAKSFSYIIRANQAGDRGMRYQYRWIAVTPALGQSLVQGCNAFVEETMATLEEDTAK